MLELHSAREDCTALRGTQRKIIWLREKGVFDVVFFWVFCLYIRNWKFLFGFNFFHELFLEWLNPQTRWLTEKIELCTTKSFYDNLRKSKTEAFWYKPVPDTSPSICHNFCQFGDCDLVAIWRIDFSNLWQLKVLGGVFVQCSWTFFLFHHDFEEPFSCKKKAVFYSSVCLRHETAIYWQLIEIWNVSTKIWQVNIYLTFPIIF